MATPVEISSNFDVASDNPNNGGPFIIAGILYQMCYDFFGRHIHMFSSSDNGITWVEQDSTHAPTISSTNPASLTDGTTIYVVSSTGSFMTILTFDTVTELWGTSPTVTTNGNDSAENPSVAYRSGDNSIIIVGQVSESGPARIRCEFFIFNITSQTWSAWSPCGYVVVDSTDCFNFGLVPGTAGVFWIVFVQTGSGSNLLVQSISGSVLGSLTTISSVGTSAFQFAAAFSDGSNIIIAWNADESTEILNVWQGPVSTMSLVEQDVNIGAGFQYWNVTRAAGIGAVLFVLSSTNTFQYVDPGSGFGSQILVTGAMEFFAIYPVLLSGSKFGFIFDGSVWWLGPSVTVTGAAFIDAGSLGFLSMPNSAGSMCKFARQIRCKKPAVHPILTGKVITYGKVE
jgi:hypothetical protein